MKRVMIPDVEKEWQITVTNADGVDVGAGLLYEVIGRAVDALHVGAHSVMLEPLLPAELGG